jgi:hypothetical protein
LWQDVLSINKSSTRKNYTNTTNYRLKPVIFRQYSTCSYFPRYTTLSSLHTRGW